MKLLIGILAASSCLANVKAGLRAYDRGDFVSAAREWSEDAAQDNREGQYNLALLYRDGEGVPRDLPKAFELLSRSARQGFGDAQAEFARFLAKGLAGPADPVQARQWYQRSADQGSVMALNGLGLMYLNGEGGAVDYPRALELFTKAAPLSAAALFNVGLMHEMGWGVPKNGAEACAWYTVSAEAGDEAAIKERDENCKALSSGDRTLARKRITSLRWDRALSWIGRNGMSWAGIASNILAFISGCWFLARYARSRYAWLPQPLSEEAHRRYLERTRSRIRRWFLWYRPPGIVAWLLHLVFYAVLAVSVISFAALATLPFGFASLAFGLTLVFALMLTHAVAGWRDKRVIGRASV